MLQYNQKEEGKPHQTRKGKKMMYVGYDWEILGDAWEEVAADLESGD